MTGDLVITVAGKPRPKGSMQAVGPHGRGGMKEANSESAPWREAVKWAAMRSTGVRERVTEEPWVPLTGPVEVDVLFCFVKPASYPKTKQSWPVTRSTYDVDKLLRNVCDALTDASVWRDDSQVVRIVGEKTFDDLPGARITVRPVSGPEPA